MLMSVAHTFVNADVWKLNLKSHSQMCNTQRCVTEPKGLPMIIFILQNSSEMSNISLSCVILIRISDLWCILMSYQFRAWKKYFVSRSRLGDSEEISGEVVR